MDCMAAPSSSCGTALSMPEIPLTREDSLRSDATNLGWPNVQPFLTDRNRNGSAGQISKTSTKNREIQFGLKLVF